MDTFGDSCTLLDEKLGEGSDNVSVVPYHPGTGGPDVTTKSVRVALGATVSTVMLTVLFASAASWLVNPGPAVNAPLPIDIWAVAPGLSVGVNVAE